jgi:site-specific DNA recombinase
MVPVRALVYSRVSTDAQERDGTSLDTQERACVEYAQAKNWTVVECITDTASGSNLERPGIERVRQLLRQGTVEVVVCYAVDRLSRNQNHIGVLFDEVERTGSRFEFVTEKFEDTAIGRFILAARAFIGEVEREKIAERTMRGKAERARSGKIPQGTGIGCYGYTYDRETGTRTVASPQATVIREIFSDFLSGVPIVSITNRLNYAGVPTFSGSKWYPVSIHNVLRNETYTGRTIYRRTSVSMIRDPKTGRKKRLVAKRDPSEWIEILGATPMIIEPAIFESAQRILDDPERRRRGRTLHNYVLSGRIKCLKCGKAMVGQTLQGQYRYYRCRRAFAGPKHDRCPTVYVRADGLEQAIRTEAARVLANPELVLAEAERIRNQGVSHIEVADLGSQLTSLENRRGRLLKLYEMGEIDDEYFLRESNTLKAEKAKVEDQVRQMSPPDNLPRITDLQQDCRRIEEWVLRADGDDFSLLLDALQIEVHAERGRGKVKGLIPEYAPRKSDADVRSMVISFRLFLSASPSRFL